MFVLVSLNKNLFHKCTSRISCKEYRQVLQISRSTSPAENYE